MKHVDVSMLKSRQSAFILFFMTLLTVIGLFYAPQSLSATEKQDAIALKLTTSSAKAMATIANRFGEVNDLFYLYSADEKGETIELGFPGQLVVAPDQTPLVDLLSDTSATIRINAEIEVLEQLLQSGSPAARIEDNNHHIVGILTTRKVMDPIRTGAVMRAPKATAAQSVESPAHASPAAPAAEAPSSAQPVADLETEKAADQPAADHTADTRAEHPATEQKPASKPDHPAAGPEAETKPEHQTAESNTDAGQEHLTPQPETDTAPGHAAPDETAHKTNTSNVSNLVATEKSADHAAPDHAPTISEPAPAIQKHVNQEHATQGDPAPKNPDQENPDQENPDQLQPAHDAAPAENLPTGAAFVDALIQPLHFELNDRFWGWRPNDLIPAGDNVANFQLGVLEISRRSAVILAEKMSRTGATAAFDPDLENAMNWFMIKPGRYWFPSAESKYKEALNAFGAYKDRLVKGQAKFFNRADNLIPLLKVYENLLGSCEENLVKTIEEDGVPVSFFKSDDYLFYTKGVVSALGTILQAIEHDFKDVIASRQAEEDFRHAIESCHHVMEINPALVFNSSPSSILANHRANMAAPVSHARFFLTVLIKALST